MAADLPPPENWLDLLASKWFLIVTVGGHLIRTEVSRAVMRRDLNALKEAQKQDRDDAAAVRREDQERLDKRLDGMSDDLRAIRDHLMGKGSK